MRRTPHTHTYQCGDLLEHGPEPCDIPLRIHVDCPACQAEQPYQPEAELPPATPTSETEEEK